MLFISQQTYARDAVKKPTILFLHHTSEYLAGMENHVLASLKTFIEHGHEAYAVVPPDSKIQRQAAVLGLPTISSNALNHAVMLARELKNICADKKVDIVVCQLQQHLEAVNVLKQGGFKVLSILKLHMHGIAIIQQLLRRYDKKNKHCWPDGIICVNHHQVNEIRALEKKKEIQFKHVICSPSFFLTERFCKPLPERCTKAAILGEDFAINAAGRPVFCMIANMYPRVHKNHMLLFQALQILKQEYNDSFLCILAGDGPQRKQLEAEVACLQLQGEVIFLGYTNKIVELLMGCDFHVLSSTNESFGIAHVEAGLLERASIGATQTGAEDIILHGRTGLIFKNNNAADLAAKIHMLLADPVFASTCGYNAAIHIKKNLSNEMKYEQHMALFSSLQNIGEH